MRFKFYYVLDDPKSKMRMSYKSSHPISMQADWMVGMKQVNILEHWLYQIKIDKLIRLFKEAGKYIKGLQK